MSYFEEEEFDTKFNGRTVLRIVAQAMSHWKWLVGFLVCIGLVSASESYLTYVVKLVIDEGIVPQDQSALRFHFSVFGAVIIGQAVLVFGFIYLAGVLGERIQYDLRKHMFDHLQELSFSYFDRTPVGWLMARVTSDSGRIAELATWGLLDATWGSLNIATALFFMVYINWRLALIVFAVVPLLIYVALRFKAKIIIEYREVRRINSRITGAYNEGIQGVKVTKALCREKRNRQEFGELTGNMFRAGFRAAWLSALFLPVVQIISAFAIGAIIWYSGIEVRTGWITVGSIQAFISYVTFMLWPIQDLARVYAEMQNSVASAERVFSLIDAEADVKNKPKAFDPGSIRGEIRFENVDFYYEKNNPVLKNFSLVVAPGETIALVGPTGGGKTTIVNLICRFYEPTSGKITIAQKDYTDFTLHSIQSRIGIVLQDPHLFSGTIRENIRYGRIAAADNEVEDAAKLSHAHDFIVDLKKGYSEEVGEGGNLLSVGQKQLVSLARAMLARPDIFIMDEATSSIDTLTEQRIQMGMEALMEGRTSFLIAHRLSTIRRADRILVIKDGAVEESGSHDELIKARGHYHSLYTKQLLDEKEKAILAADELNV
jgi:ATP-binding cassette subfamily B protein